ncbi:uncharacterized protein LOC144124244 [Amblyomma americanum]
MLFHVSSLVLVVAGLCHQTAATTKSRGIFLETDRSYKYDLPTSLTPSKESNCSGKCVHVFMGLLCDFVDEQANCGEQFLRCCVGGIFSQGASRKSGMMDDAPTDHGNRDGPGVLPTTTTASTSTTSTTESPVSEAQPVVDTPPSSQEPEPTLQPSTTASSVPSKHEDDLTLTAMESQQSPQIESPLPQRAETASKLPACPGSCIMSLLGLLCGSINRNFSCPSGRVCCTAQSAETSVEEDAQPLTTVHTTNKRPTALPLQAPARHVPCIGRCMPMYLSNTCKRPNVVLISKKVFCPTGMICCSKGMTAESNSRDPEKNGSRSTLRPADPNSDFGGPVSPEASSQDEEYSWENQRHRRPPYIPTRQQIPIPLQQAVTHDYGLPSISSQKPISEPTLQQPNEEDMNYAYYGAGTDYDKSDDISHVTPSTRRPPIYTALRHPSLPQPVIPTPPYYDEDYDSKSSIHSPEEKDKSHQPQKETTVQNTSLPTGRPRVKPNGLSQHAPQQLKPQRGTVVIGEVFPVKNPHVPEGFEQQRKAWLQRVREKTRPQRPIQLRPVQETASKQSKPDWQTLSKPPHHETEFGVMWVEPVKASPELVPIKHFAEAAATSTGWIPFHQAHQPVNKQKVVENHYGSSSEFKPVRGTFVGTSLRSRDPNVCGVKGGKKRDPGTFKPGGAEARPGEWCWHAAIVDRKNQYLCNGVLIGAQWVLTAASCVFNHTDTTENIYVRLGYTDILSPFNPPGAQTKTVAKVYAHHSFQAETLANNIALLKLKDIVELNDAVCVVCLPTTNANSTEEESSAFTELKGCVVTGYGASVSEDDLRYMYPTLREAAVVALEEDDVCRAWQSRARHLKLDLEVRGSTFCAGDGDVQNDCVGDPARIVVCPSKDFYYEVTGISSKGLACGGPDALSVFTNVSSYSGWINQIANINRF